MLPTTLLLSVLVLFFNRFALSSPTPPTAAQPQGFSALSTLSSTLAKRGDFSPTRNDLDSDPCQRVTVIYARGTVELGNVGALAGPPFFDALEAILGAENVAVQGVDYRADIPGYLEGGDPAGAAELAAKATLAVKRCPKTQIVLSGYSQGAQVVHLGASLLPAATVAKVKAAALFGDPYRGQPLQAIPADRVVTYCFETDLICGGAPVVLPAHLAYGVYAVPAARFVAGKLS